MDSVKAAVEEVLADVEVQQQVVAPDASEDAVAVEAVPESDDDAADSEQHQQQAQVENENENEAEAQPEQNEVADDGHDGTVGESVNEDEDKADNSNSNSNSDRHESEEKSKKKRKKNKKKKKKAAETDASAPDESSGTNGNQKGEASSTEATATGKKSARKADANTEAPVPSRSAEEVQAWEAYNAIPVDERTAEDFPCAATDFDMAVLNAYHLTRRKNSKRKDPFNFVRIHEDMRHMDEQQCWVGSRDARINIESFMLRNPAFHNSNYHYLFASDIDLRMRVVNAASSSSSTRISSTESRGEEKEKEEKRVAAHHPLVCGLAARVLPSDGKVRLARGGREGALPSLNCCRPSHIAVCSTSMAATLAGTTEAAFLRGKSFDNALEWWNN